ncbi:hypothetical protein C7B65_03430 [Phormidesmis priestleyi ULC007]|uniref:CARDB domain-containing protein n=1 Tax=Phormidesmis priestleyi ULC007 TaxID=1920490 RepID=A0A2T1DME0_9CYAN|nr:FG-GAP-like repeat-containing protein [Phormidesmis priestleyi]PSB21646.1 hypothetical protein C7B65_03430 [Phormidesmis priestleyi ULC007]PZO54687.1 MAG: hypothetical protein DCF14_01950 [Phormidesmis priestleyi]
MPPTDNNTFATATPITNLIGTPPLSGLLNAGDKTDFYQFTLNGSSSTSVTLTELTGNARLHLFNGAKVEITPNPTSNSKQLSEALSTPLAPGTYYIQAELDPSDVTAIEANYKLNLSVSTDATLNNLVWRSKPDGGFSVVQTDGKIVQSSDPIKLGATPQSLSTDWQSQFGDLNGDGEDDILLRNQKDGSIGYWIMQGGTLLQFAGSPYKVPASWQSTLADFNNDDRADIFWRNKQTGETAIWLTNSTGLGFSSAAPLPGVPSGWDPTLGDFNGKDGKKDILWRNTQTGEVAVWLMDGTKIIKGGAASLSNVPDSWKPQLGDFNKDGISDILWRNTQTGGVAIWLMNGNQIATGGAASLSSVPIEWTAQVGDFEGNKADDILWRNTQTDQLAVWLLDGTQIAPSGAAFLPSPLPSRFNIERLADFNNDGKTDLLLRDSASGEVAVWLMNGTSLLDAAFLPQRSSSDQLDGIQRRQFKSTIQSIGGKAELSAFNIGTLNTAGVYTDSISSDVPDYFKFNLGFRSNLVLSATDLTGQPLSSIGLQLYKASTDGTASTPLSNDATQLLEPGDYYIKVSSSLDEINYRLNVEGKPQFTELVGNGFTGDSQVFLTLGANDTDSPVSTVSVNYSVKNAGTIFAPNVKVSFYISRDQTFSPNDYKVVSDLSFDLAANQSSPTTPLTLNLPAWRDTFWVVDGAYYLLAVVDPSNAIAETDETNNVSVLTLDVQQIPTTNLRGKSLTVNKTTFAAAETVTATFVTENNGFKSAFNMVPTDTRIQVGFYLSTTPVFNKSSTTAYNLARPSIDGIAGKSNSGPQNTSFKLPPANWIGWASPSGLQTVYIGMIQNNNEVVNDIDPDDNQNLGQGIDWVEITVNL